jgi:hypothetical protein
MYDVKKCIEWFRFWKDRWIHGKEPLVINHAHTILVGQINYPVSFYTINNGTAVRNY